MRPSVLHYTTDIKSYLLVSSLVLAVSSPVCKYVPERRAGALSPQLFYWDNAPVDTCYLAWIRHTLSVFWGIDFSCESTWGPIQL